MGRLQKKKTVAQKNRQKEKQQRTVDTDVAVSEIKKPVKKNPSKMPRVSVDKKGQEPGVVEKCRTFLKEVNAELKKVVWPTKNQTFASTAVVIVLVIIVSSFLGLFDVGLRGLISMVLH